MDGLELGDDSVFTQEQEENITQHDACSKNVSRYQWRAFFFIEFGFAPPPQKKKKSNMTLNHIDVEHEGTGCMDC